MQKCSLQVTVKELVQCTSNVEEVSLKRSHHQISFMQSQEIVQCTSNIEEVALKWSLHEISFIQSQKGKDES